MKKYLISAFHHHLYDQVDFPPAMRCALHCHMEMHYLERGRTLKLSAPSVGFVVSGLVKEYRRAAKTRVNFMQLITLGDTFIYAPQQYANKCMALEPTWILYLDLKDLVHLFPLHKSIGEWMHLTWAKHEVRHALPIFLRELPDKQERIAIFRAEFGSYVEYLSINEISQYLAVDSMTCRKAFGELF